MLRVLDAPAEVLAVYHCGGGPAPGRAHSRVAPARARGCLVLMSLERLLVDVEHLAVAAVANRVHAQLIIVDDREFRRAGHVLERVGVEPTRGRQIAVGLEHPGAARSQRAVDRALDGSNREAFVAVVDRAVLRHVDREAIGRLAQHHPHAKRQLALVDDLLHHLDRRRRRAGVADGRQPFRQRFLRGEIDVAPKVGLDLGRRSPGPIARQRVGDERLGPLVEQTRGIATAVFQDLSALRILGRPRDARRLHRLRVREPGVAARVREPYRVVRRRAAERFVQREAFDVRRRHVRPFFLMPAAPEDPFARLRALRRVADHAHDVVPVGGGGELQVPRRFADAGEVDVRVDETGRRQRAFEIDHPRVRTDVRLNLLVRSDRDDRVA